MRARRGRGAWILAAAALLGVLIAARFPYQRLLGPLLAGASAATGAQIEVGEVGLSLGWSGPRLVARDLRLSWPGAAALSLAAVRVRPAWSPAWLSGVPLWHVEATGDPGTFRGVVASDRVAGQWSAIDVDALPWILLGSTPPLHGRVSGEADLARQDGAWRGSAKLQGAGGSVDLPGLPVAIPFEALEAHLDLGPGRRARARQQRSQQALIWEARRDQDPEQGRRRQDPDAATASRLHQIRSKDETVKVTSSSSCLSARVRMRRLLIESI